MADDNDDDDGHIAANGGASNAEYSKRVNARIEAVGKVNEQRQRELTEQLAFKQRALQTKWQEEHALAERQFHERVNMMQARHKREQDELKDYWQREMAPERWQNAEQWAQVEARVKRHSDERCKAMQEEGERLHDDWLWQVELFQRRVADETKALEEETANRIASLRAVIEGNIADAYAQLFEPLPRYRQAVIGNEQRAEFRQRGFTVLRGVVPPDVANRALQRVNAALARGFTHVEMTKRYRRPQDECSAEIQALLTHTPLLAIVRSLVRDAAPTMGGQIAARFPGFGAVDNAAATHPLADGTAPLFEAPEWWSRSWHVDGGDTLSSQGRLGQFSVLVGVLLDDVEQEFSGNLTVYEGGHRLMSDHIASVGAASMLADPKHFDTAAREAINPRLAPPTQITGRQGDVVLAHYLMPHTVSPHLGTRIRYAVYFRVSARHLGDLEKQSKPYHEPSLLNVEHDFDFL